MHKEGPINIDSKFDNVVDSFTLCELDISLAVLKPTGLMYRMKRCGNVMFMVCYMVCI